METSEFIRYILELILLGDTLEDMTEKEESRIAVRFLA
jgi:hypothetical protein